MMLWKDVNLDNTEKIFSSDFFLTWCNCELQKKEVWPIICSEAKGRRRGQKISVKHQVLLYFPFILKDASPFVRGTVNYRLRTRLLDVCFLFSLEWCFVIVSLHLLGNREILYFNHKPRGRVNGRRARSNGGWSNYRLLFNPFSCLMHPDPTMKSPLIPFTNICRLIMKNSKAKFTIEFSMVKIRADGNWLDKCGAVSETFFELRWSEDGMFVHYENGLDFYYKLQDKLMKIRIKWSSKIENFSLIILLWLSWLFQLSHQNAMHQSTST